jgi:RimJ/RimL family protein N-acetyltransferase
MLNIQPVTLTDGRIRLEPMSLDHVDALKAAAADGELWNLRVTSVPAPEDTRGYVERALAMKDRLPFVVVDLENGNRIVGSSSYHDILPVVDRVEIGWTWYAKSVQRTRSRRWARRWWAGALTTTTSRARRPSSAWARRRTA